jgi:hypothetical protein
MRDAGKDLPGLSVHLRKQADGPIVASEAVKPRDLAEPMAELGFAAGLRRGDSQRSLAELSAWLRPVYRSTRKAGRYGAGFTLETDEPSGETTICRFEREVLDGAAVRASRRLVEEGVIAKGDLYYYELHLVEQRIDPIVIEGAAAPPVPEIVRIPPLLERSREVRADRRQGLEDEAYAREQVQAEGSPESYVIAASSSGGDAGIRPETTTGSCHYPVFYTQHALAKAERTSRKGAQSTPAIETGGLLIGRLCWCPETRTLYAIVDDVLEASHAEGTTYTMTFTGRTWERIQVVLEARRRRPETRHQRILGQCHGHSFLPYDQGETCDGCPSQGVCGLSTAYLSDSDRRWCRAVFPREPWQLSHVFGLTPRREAVNSFYGQRGAVLERREYFVLGESS